MNFKSVTVFFSMVFVVSFGCKPLDESELQTLDKLASGSDDKNVCSARPGTKINIGSFKIKVESKNKDSEDLVSRLVLSLTAMDQFYRDALRGLQVKYLLTDNTQKACGVNNALACTRVIPQSQAIDGIFGNIIVLPADPGDVANLAIKKSMEFLLENVAARQNQQQFYNLQMALGAGFLGDIKRSQGLYSISRFESQLGPKFVAAFENNFKSTGGNVDLARLGVNSIGLTDFLYQVSVESYDSFFCNTYASQRLTKETYAEILKDKQFSRLTKYKNTRNFFQIVFQNTFAKFSAFDNFVKGALAPYAKIGSEKSGSENKSFSLGDRFGYSHYVKNDTPRPIIEAYYKNAQNDLKAFEQNARSGSWLNPADYFRSENSRFANRDLGRHNDLKADVLTLRDRLKPQSTRTGPMGTQNSAMQTGMTGLNAYTTYAESLANAAQIKAQSVKSGLRSTLQSGGQTYRQEGIYGVGKGVVGAAGQVVGDIGRGGRDFLAPSSTFSQRLDGLENIPIIDGPVGIWRSNVNNGIGMFRNDPNVTTQSMSNQAVGQAGDLGIDILSVKGAGVIGNKIMKSGVVSGVTRRALSNPVIQNLGQSAGSVTERIGQQIPQRVISNAPQLGRFGQFASGEVRDEVVGEMSKSAADSSATPSNFGPGSANHR